MLRWRTLEWAGAAFIIFVQTGAVVPLVAGAHGISTAASRPLALVAYLVTIVLLVRCRDQLRLAVGRSLPFALLLAMPFVSVLWSISGSITLRRAIALALSVAVAYLLAIRFSPRQLAMLVGSVLGGCMLLSLLFGVALPGLAWMPTGTGLRGVFVHKNILGWYAAISTVALSALLGEADRRVRVAALVATGASLVCLAGSGSMTGMLSLCAAAGLAIFYRTYARLRGASRRFFVLVALQFVAVLAISATELVVPLLEALGRDATLTGRVPLWRAVDAHIGRHLMLGVGYQAFWTDANPEAWGIWSRVGWPAPHAHSGYRDTLLNFGVTGALVFALVIARTIAQGASLLVRAPGAGWLWLNVYVGMFLVMNLTESLFLVQNEFLFVLFTTAALMFSLRQPELARGASRPDETARAGPGYIGEAA